MKNLFARCLVYLFAINGIALALYIVIATILGVTGNAWLMTDRTSSDWFYAALLVVAAYPATFVGKKSTTSHEAN